MTKQITQKDVMNLMVQLCNAGIQSPQYLIVPAVEALEEEYKNIKKWDEDLFSPAGLYIIGVLK